MKRIVKLTEGDIRHAILQYMNQGKKLYPNYDRVDIEVTRHETGDQREPTITNVVTATVYEEDE